MPDVLTQEQRSFCMSRIRGRNTQPEVQLRKVLWALGARFRVYAKLPGKPDIVFSGAKVAIFVDGCFWHGCPEHRVQPKTNREFWLRKLRQNRARDRKVGTLLVDDGWVVLRFWEHHVRLAPDQTAQAILRTVERRLRAGMMQHSRKRPRKVLRTNRIDT